MLHHIQSISCLLRAPFSLPVRIYDVPMSNKAQMMAFLERYTGKDERFFSPVDTGDGGPVALQVRGEWLGTVALLVLCHVLG